MVMIFGENDCLPQLLSVLNPKPLFHQNVQHLTNGVVIKNPLVQCRRLDFFRQSTLLCAKSLLIHLLFFRGKFVIHDPLFQKL